MQKSAKRLAIVGAGVAGLTLAQRMQSAGWSVTLIEKSRGPGGRLSTRRRDGGQFDHGAQYFTARTQAFAHEISGWAREGWVEQWNGSFYRWLDSRLEPDPVDRPRWVGVPRMSGLTRALSAGLTIVTASRAESLIRKDAAWAVRTESGELYDGFDWVVLTCPGPQALALAPSGSPVAERAQQLNYAPCWAAMMESGADFIPEYDGLRLEHPVLAWVARDSSKPGRPDGCRWVVHASAEWTEANVDATGEDVARCMREAFEAITGVQPTSVTVHRWLYALASNDGGTGSCIDPTQSLGLCGDALLGGRVEDAWLSAHHLAKSLLTIEQT